MPKFILSHAKVQIWTSYYPLGPKKRNQQQKQQMHQSLMEQHFDKNQQQKQQMRQSLTEQYFLRISSSHDFFSTRK